MSSSTTRKYAEESIGKRLSNINVETIKSNKLALPKLLFTSPGNTKYHFAHCGGEESRLKAASTASSAIGGVEGAFAGFLVHTMFQACLGSQAASLLPAWGPWVTARNFGAAFGVHSGLSSTMIHIRGKPELMSSMAAASGAGLTYSLLLRRPTNSVLATCLGFAALNGIEPYIPTTTTSLEKFEKNFNNEHLTDSALPLLTDKSQNEEVQIQSSNTREDWIKTLFRIVKLLRQILKLSKSHYGY
ncbi:unnamed protein product [Arabis nemorensis]|uniref:Mitochondrial import inner membrane translocase subunit TIM22 n=1 Tax=Arabis nemorensis TaxID=586526 RepID=A0A565B686_9BRAS|nr:unnamed protein product [Arabis nemorensis]